MTSRTLTCEARKIGGGRNDVWRRDFAYPAVPIRDEMGLANRLHAANAATAN